MTHSVSAHMCFRGQKCGENARFRCTRVSINGIEFWGKSQIQANEKQSRDRVFADVLSILKVIFPVSPRLGCYNKYQVEPVFT